MYTFFWFVFFFLLNSSIFSTSNIDQIFANWVVRVRLYVGNQTTVACPFFLNFIKQLHPSCLGAGIWFLAAGSSGLAVKLYKYKDDKEEDTTIYQLIVCSNTKLVEWDSPSYILHLLIWVSVRVS